MSDNHVDPLRQRMIEDMTARQFLEDTQACTALWFFREGRIPRSTRGSFAEGQSFSCVVDLPPTETAIRAGLRLIGIG